MKLTSLRESVLRAVELLDDDDVLWLHREVSRRAQEIRARDPAYQRHYQAGVEASRRATQ